MENKKIYEVIMQDEWNNLYLMGFYFRLSDAIPDINDWLSPYDYKLEDGALSEYASTFSSAFDLDIGMLEEDREDLCGIMVRGFILSKEAIQEELNKPVQLSLDIPEE